MEIEKYIFVQGRKKLFTQEGKERVKLWLEEGQSYNSISQKLGMNPDTLSKMCKEEKIHIDNRKKYALDTDYFKKIDSKEKAYWLGFLSADGYVNKQRGYVCFELQAKDEESLILFNKAIGSNRSIKNILSANKYLHKRLTISNRTFTNSLVYHGCVQNKSLILKPPKISNQYLLYWILGYYDGDGGICIFNGRKNSSKKRYKSYFTGTYEVLSFIKEYLNVGSSIRKEHNCTNTYNLTLTESKTKEFLSKAYDEDTIQYCMKRKYKKFLSIL